VRLGAVAAGRFKHDAAGERSVRARAALRARQLRDQEYSLASPKPIHTPSHQALELQGSPMWCSQPSQQPLPLLLTLTLPLLPASASASAPE